MYIYTEKVLQEFLTPSNTEDIEVTVRAEVGNIVCGDILSVSLYINNNIIERVQCKTFGCVAAVASASVASKLVKGKTIEEALNISNEIVCSELGGLPSQKKHCSLLAMQAIHKAIFMYKESKKKEDNNKKKNINNKRNEKKKKTK